MKRCLTLLIIRERQIKTMIRYHLTLVRMAIIKKFTNNKYWRGMEYGDPSYTVVGWGGGTVSWCSHYGAQCGDSSENYKQTYRMIQQFHSCADKIIIQKSSK